VHRNSGWMLEQAIERFSERGICRREGPTGSYAYIFIVRRDTGMEFRRCPADLEQVAQDLAYLSGVGDDRDESRLTGDRATGSRCPLRGQLPQEGSTSYTFTIRLAHAERQAACDTVVGSVALA
jgi:hypothetical protein